MFLKGKVVPRTLFELEQVFSHRFLDLNEKRHDLTFYSYSKRGDVNIRRSELSREAHVSFILDAGGRSRTETYDVQEIDKRTDYRCS